MSWFYRKPKPPPCEHRGCGYTVEVSNRVWMGTCNRCQKEIPFPILLKIHLDEIQETVTNFLNEEHGDRTDA